MPTAYSLNGKLDFRVDPPSVSRLNPLFWPVDTLAIGTVRASLDMRKSLYFQYQGYSRRIVAIASSVGPKVMPKEKKAC